MKVINGTDYNVELIQAIDKNGKRHAVIMAKGTFAFPDANYGIPTVAEEQSPILAADVFEGEPGLSTPFFESDYVPYKPKCDVVVKATAHAPKGRPVRRLHAEFRFGNVKKRVKVSGDRVWKIGLLILRRSWPKPFTSMPITYGRAFGGTWVSKDGKQLGASYARNPVGCGFGRWRHFFRLLGKPVPNVEKPGFTNKWPLRRNKPWSFGPIGRSWTPRNKYGGTYDKKWLDDIFPLLPPDFDERYYQCAPADQQTRYPSGGEEVRLVNLHPHRPDIRFTMPALDLPMTVELKNSRPALLKPVVDSVIIDADAGQISVVWRVRHPIKRSLREVETIIVGDPNDERVKAALQSEDGCGCGSGCGSFATGYVAPVLEELDL